MRRSALAALLAAAMLTPGGAAFATSVLAPDVPHRVTGVAEDDVLYMRAKPDATAPIVGALSPVQRGLFFEERIAGWARVTHRDITGWISTNFVTPDFERATPEPKLACSGTEPFWGLTSDETTVTLTSPEGEEKLDASPWTAAVNAGHHVRTAGKYTIVVTENRLCSDGMSETQYTFSGTVTDGTIIWGGCCNPAP